MWKYRKKSSRHLGSDGNVIVHTEGHDYNVTFNQYTIVDGKFKVAGISGMGAVLFSDMEMDSNGMKLTDEDGDYVILRKERWTECGKHRREKFD